MIVSQHGLRLTGLDARIRGTCYIESERDFARAFKRGRGKQCGSERKTAIEVDFGAAERRIEPCRRLSGCKPIGHSPFQRLAVDLRLESIDGNAFAAERNGAAAAHRTEWRPDNPGGSVDAGDSK